MARKKIETPMHINDLIPQYAEHKAEMDSLKKICDEENKGIKAIMRDLIADGTIEDNKYSSGGYMASYIVQKRESMNEDMLLDIFHKNWVVTVENYDIVKTREYIDFDALESAIYKGEIPKEMLLDIDKAREIKEVETLKVTKVKEEN